MKQENISKPSPSDFRYVDRVLIWYMSCWPVLFLTKSQNWFLFLGLPPVVTVDFGVGEDVCCDIWFKPFLVGDVVKSLISAGMVGSSSLFLLSGLPLLSSPLSRLCHRLRTLLVSYLLHHHLISYFFSIFSQKDSSRNKWRQYVLRIISATMKNYANSICRYPKCSRKISWKEYAAILGVNLAHLSSESFFLPLWPSKIVSLVASTF